MKYFLTFLFLILQQLQTYQKEHVCMHHEAQSAIEPQTTQQDHHETARLLNSEYEGIRIHSNFDFFNVGTSENRAYVRQLMESAVHYYSQVLSVKPSSGVYSPFAELCGIDLPDYMVFPNSVDTDLIILVTSENDSSASYIAWARWCLLDGNNYRPIIGQINFNLFYVDVTDDPIQIYDDLATSLHELGHIFALSPSLYDFFIDPDTGLLVNDALETETINSETRYFLKGDTLLTRVREHFNCPTLKGALLESQNESGAGAHFERKVFKNDLMTSSAISNIKMTFVTLAAYEASGWYQVDYSYEEPLLHGKDEGCGFITDDCVGAGPNYDAQFDSFCSPLALRGCNKERTADSICGGFGPFSTDPSMPDSQNHWGNFTQTWDFFADHCPYLTYIGGRICTGDSGFKENSLEMFSSASRCFDVVSNSDATLGYCFESVCSQDEFDQDVLTIQIGADEIVCTSEGLVSTSLIPGIKEFECPDPQYFCENIGVPTCPFHCMASGDCDSSSTCQCYDGFSGTYCMERLVQEEDIIINEEEEEEEEDINTGGQPSPVNEEDGDTIGGTPFDLNSDDEEEEDQQQDASESSSSDDGELHPAVYAGVVGGVLLIGGGIYAKFGKGKWFQKKSPSNAQGQQNANVQSQGISTSVYPEVYQAGRSEPIEYNKRI